MTGMRAPSFCVALDSLLPAQHHLSSLTNPFVFHPAHRPTSPSRSHAGLHNNNSINNAVSTSSRTNCDRSSAATSDAVQSTAPPPLRSSSPVIESLHPLARLTTSLQTSLLQVLHLREPQQLPPRQQHLSPTSMSSLWVLTPRSLASHSPNQRCTLSSQPGSSFSTPPPGSQSGCRRYRAPPHSNRLGDEGDERRQDSSRRGIQRSITRCKSLAQLSLILVLHSPDFDAVHTATAAGMAARLCDGALQHPTTVGVLKAVLPLLHAHATSLDLQALGQSLAALAELGLSRTHPTCSLLLGQLQRRLTGRGPEQGDRVVTAAGEDILPLAEFFLDGVGLVGGG
ncbi:MAG: hypothetical protein WDW38_000312 [Sanguina aurantia]